MKPRAPEPAKGSKTRLPSTDSGKASSVVHQASLGSPERKDPQRIPFREDLGLDLETVREAVDHLVPSDLVGSPEQVRKRLRC
ncbi:MAG: hypothetical protein CL910_15165 [Deltaproteobacteria bacterium]|nr:hypothetical protein [Deltaproteobacteria bacterium]